MYFAALDDMAFRHIAQATQLRIAILNVLNQSTKGVATYDHVMGLANGVLRKLRFDKHLYPMYILALFRSGLEEDANNLEEAALQAVHRQVSMPWSLPSLLSMLSFFSESLAKSMKLRKKNKVKRVQRHLVEVHRALERHTKVVKTSKTWRL